MDEQIQNYKSAIEAILFVSEKPVVLDQLKEVFPELKPSQIHDLIKQLQEEYVNREAGMVVVEIAGGFQMLSNSHAAAYIREFYKTKTKEKLSRPALESLAIIAYKQPVGRAEVEVIRGVNSDGTIAHLLNKGLDQDHRPQRSAWPSVFIWHHQRIFGIFWFKITGRPA